MGAGGRSSRTPGRAGWRTRGRTSPAAGSPAGTEDTSCRVRAARHPLVTRAVVPEDLALALVGDRELHERLDPLPILGIEVGPIGREDDGVVAHVIDDLFHEVLVGLHGHEALEIGR